MNRSRIIATLTLAIFVAPMSAAAQDAAFPPHTTIVGAWQGTVDGDELEIAIWYETENKFRGPILPTRTTGNFIAYASLKNGGCGEYLHGHVLDQNAFGYDIAVERRGLSFSNRGETSHLFADCEVLAGGRISNRKGVNVPDVVLPLAALSDKDRKDLEFVCELGVDWLALSFVQRREDVDEARALAKGRAAILSKIEKPSAVTNFEEILEVSDGIMVARGDLGVELPVQNVPPIQKRLVRKCRNAAKPVIVATQMLESMIESPMPTRAEVSDVAAAIYEGADAIMLSAESAAGDFPIEAVTTMNNVAVEVEGDPTYREIIEASRGGKKETVADGIVSAAREIAETTNIKLICCFSESGSTAALTARERPSVPILALTSRQGTARRMCLTWGCHCVKVGTVGRFKEAVLSAVRAATEQGLAEKTDQIVVTAGVPFGQSGSTNILRIAPCDERLIFASELE